MCAHSPRITSRWAAWLGALLVCTVSPTLAAGDVRAAPDPSLDVAEKRYVLRAGLETLGILAGGTVWYWQNLDFNAPDWDLRWDWPSWRRKVFTLDAVRFDQNRFFTNAVYHSQVGLAYYSVARGNGFDPGSSMLMTIGATLAWEYLVEFKELVSLNDLIVNPVAGWALGEPIYQIGEVFRASRPTLLNRAVGGFFSPIATMNDRVDERPRPPREATGRLGITRERWHRFELSAATTTAIFDQDTIRRETDLGVGAEVVTQRGYGRPGRFSTWIKPGAWTKISGDLSFDRRGVLGAWVLSDVVIAGSYHQDFWRDDLGRVRGYGLLVGIGSGFEYHSRQRPTGRDFLAAMNIVGPTAELTARLGGFQLRWQGAAYGTFGMVKSLAMDGLLAPEASEAGNPYGGTSGVKSTLATFGYYHAAGVTGASRLVFEYWGWDAGLEARGDYFDSIEGFDRFQERIEDDFNLIDTRWVPRVWIGVKPWADWAHLSASLTWLFRSSKARDRTAEVEERTASLVGSFAF